MDAFCSSLVEAEHRAIPVPAQAKTYALVKDETLVLERAHGTTFECNEGNIWLTQYGDSRDIVLGRGERFQVDHGTVVVVSALRASVLTLRRTAPPPLLADGWRAVPGRLLRSMLAPRWRAAANARMWMRG